MTVRGPASEPILVDARGMRCPWPALRLARAMRGADSVLLRADDPDAAREVTALAAAHGWAIADTSCTETERQWLVSR